MSWFNKSGSVAEDAEQFSLGTITLGSTISLIPTDTTFTIKAEYA